MSNSEKKPLNNMLEEYDGQEVSITDMPYQTNKKRNRSTIFLNLGIIAFVIVLCLVIYSLRSVVMPFFMAFLLAYVLLPVVKYFLKKHIPVVFVILLVYLLILLALYLIVFIALPNFLQELENLSLYLPDMTSQFQGWWDNIRERIETLALPANLQNGISDFFTSTEQKLGGFLQSTNFSVTDFLRYLGYFLLAPILSYYILRDKELIKKKLISILPPSERPELLRIARDINHLIRQFIFGYVLVAFMVGVLSFIALYLMGVKYALLLGIIMGLMDLIPYFGPFIGMAPAIIFALMQSPTLAIFVVIVLGAIQQFESIILTPKIVGGRIGLHPLVIIFVVMGAGVWFGIMGMLLAVPITAALRLIIAYFYSRLVAWQGREAGA